MPTHLEDGGKIHHLAKNRGVAVKKEGSNYGNGIGILTERYGDGIDEKWNQNPTTSACEDHGNKLERRGRVLAQTSKHIGAFIRNGSSRARG
jgi:hypothetical protein